MKNRRGFTLIELLVVVVIIGLLASIAIPKFSATKDKARLASVRTDLRNIMTSEEAYFADYNTFGDFSDLQNASNFTLSPGNSATVTPGVSGYSADVANATISSGVTQCQVTYGSGTTAGVDGVVVCS
jgi:prepilin-type N-terminal cleavage/methylation domain-containing protein